MSSNHQGSNNIIKAILAYFFFFFGCLSLVFGIVLFPVVFLLGLGITTSGIRDAFVGNQTLTCSRLNPSKIDCQVKKNSFMGEEIIQTIPDLKGAKVKTTQWKKGLSEQFSYSYQILLISKTSTVPFLGRQTFEYPNPKHFTPTVLQINNLITNPKQKVLEIESENNFPVVIVIGISLIIVGSTPVIIGTIVSRIKSRKFTVRAFRSGRS